MDNIELIKRLSNFYIYANEGFYIDKIFENKNYIIAYSSKVKDYDCNYAINLKIKNKEDFNNLQIEIDDKMSKLNRKTCYIVSPLDLELYNNREDFFRKDKFEEVSNEVWQIFDDFENLDNIETNCKLNIRLEKTNDMKNVGIISNESFKSDDKKDPYGEFDEGYLDIYQDYIENTNSNYLREFYYIKLDEKIVGVTVLVFGDGICGIYGLAIKKEYRKLGIGKEALKKQLQICKDKNIDLAFLQTEDGFYPADTYRKFGFKDVCNLYYYIKKDSNN